MLKSISAFLQTISFISCLVQPGRADVVDDFSDASRWAVVRSEGVDVKFRDYREDAHDTAMRVDIEFVTGGGYGGIRRELPLDLPANFELAFSTRGDLPPNDLELKLVDESGNNVWWVNRRRFEFPQDWTRLAARRRHFEFAWGPSDAPLRRASAIEIIVASAEGGRGTLYLDDLTLRPLPETKPYTGKPTLAASSSDDALSSSPKAAMDGQNDSQWRSAVHDTLPTITVDFGSQREFGGLILHWDRAALPSRYAVEFSDDGEQWNTVRRVDAGSRVQFLSLPDAESRAVRLVITPPATKKSVALREIEVLPLESSRDANVFATEVARRAPRGHFPRATLGEGTFWTLVGVPLDDHEALVSEDGAVEVDKRGFSIEPFLWVNGDLHTWADATTTQSLAEGWAPAPTVLREYNDLNLEVTSFADGAPGSASLWSLYTVTNKSEEAIDGSLLLAVRPFQVNPPYQWLNTVGGVARIEHVAFRESGRVITVDDKQVALGTAPDCFGSTTFDEGDVTRFLGRGRLPPHAQVSDPQRAASAAVNYRFQLEPDASRTWVLCVPFSTDQEGGAQSAQELLASSDPVKYGRRKLQANVEQWRAATSTFDLLVPDQQTEIVNTIRSTLAYILINRDGPAIQPGSRSYERSWIRDGSLTATALLRFGLEQPAREFVDWYAPYQFESGKVPCVVDRRGPDPVPENDSHGQLIMAVMNVYRFTSDEAFLRKHWPRVKKAVDYIETLRGERLSTRYSDAQSAVTHQEAGKPAVSLHAFYGLMPESISHEGYSAKPMHSYWDDFFTLRGLKDAAEMARILGQQSDSQRYNALADDFARTLYASLELTQQAHGIDYIPGCVELGDFDATSTTIALWPCGELHRLPRPALDRTFDRYWEQFVRRRDDPNFAWKDYTPYEVRVIGSLILLGQKERAEEAMEFFLRDRRPPAWNQWPEIVYREPRTAQFVGDLPHTWCASDFINSVRMMFLHERENDRALVLLAGVPKSWLTTEPVGFRDMPTYGGRMSCLMSQTAAGSNRLTAQLSGSCPLPNGGIRLTSPLGPVQRAQVNGRPAEIDADGRVVVREVPAEVEMEH